ncbi:MAG: histidine kinase [Brumimicrobium sp.]|nr:histidine kinase [Brumimicrobium sp.]MCO5268876.1 histidine kinase [Brumimicrobium sp.]
MKKRKILYWIIQLTSWGVFCFILAIANIVNEKENVEAISKIINKIFFLYIFLITISHTMRMVLIKRGWLDLKIIQLVPRAIGLVIIASLFLLALNEFVNFFIFNEVISYLEFFVNIWMYSLLLLVWLAIYLTNHLLDRSRIQEMNNLILQTSQTKTELKVLRDQLNPHFLFNSLNSIRALIETDPYHAKSAITNLSNLLRSSLALGKKTLVNLDEEIYLITEYLKLEKIRYEERLHYEINNNVHEPVIIPPFLLQGMIENAIKHGISRLVNGGNIEININFKDDKLFLEVINSGKFSQEKEIDKPESRVGVENTRRRLDLLYGENAQFNIQNIEGDLVKTTIWIKKSQLNREKD